MLPLIAESALRSLILGLAAFLALKVLRVRNPQVRMTIWTAVLAASLAMPLLVRLAPLTVPAPEILFVSAPTAEAPLLADTVSAAPVEPPAVLPAAPVALPFDWRMLAIVAYLAVVWIFLARLLFGLALTAGLARRAWPIQADWTEGLRVRAGEHILAPVTFGRTILLPADCVGWAPLKRRTVLLHERAHVVHGDFHVQLLAALNCAIFWLNPFAWWLKGELIALAETISDNAVLAVTDDRPAYAGVLAEIAGAGRFPMGVAMARPRTLAGRVERVLAETALPRVPSRRGRLMAALSVLPLAALAACMTPAPGPGAKVSVDNPLGGTVDGRHLPRDTSITVANWMAGVVDGVDVPGDWPRTIWITVDNVPRLMTPPAEDDLPLDWIGRKLPGDRITFQQNLKYYYIDDPATVRRAAALMDVPPEDALKGKARAEVGAIVDQIHPQMKTLYDQDNALRTQLASASSPEARADLVRRQGEIGRQLTAMDRQLKDRIAQVPNFDNHWQSYPPKMPPPAIAVKRYEHLWALIEEALQNGLAKDADSLDQKPFRSPRNSDGRPVVIIVSGNMLTSDAIAHESDFVNAWRLRDTIRGDYLWYHYRFRSHYVTDPAVIAQIEALPDGRPEAQRLIESAIPEVRKAQQERKDRRTALQDRQSALAGRDDEVRAQIADKQSPDAQGRLAQEDREILAQQEAVEKEIEALDATPINTPARTALHDRGDQAANYLKSVKQILQAAFDQGKTKPADQ